ncbi:hypothetical protein ACGF3G_00565 [Streptomyces sp. NPDC048179]|uniref:hypothetical protein n=1 Tax=Streptomyces sp. NPDC048179 TaxID=3365506 RepID=UPI00371039A2
MTNTTTAAARFVARKGNGHWYVLDTETGAVRTGMVRVGAIQVADHLNRTTP